MGNFPKEERWLIFCFKSVSSFKSRIASHLKSYMIYWSSNCKTTRGWGGKKDQITSFLSSLSSFRGDGMGEGRRKERKQRERKIFSGFQRITIQMKGLAFLPFKQSEFGVKPFSRAHFLPSSTVLIAPL